MDWIRNISEALVRNHPEGEILVSSGVSPSGTYHLGTLREVMTAEAIARDCALLGRKARHFHVSDDLDIFRKVPVDVSSEFEKYLGMPLCDVPSPDEAKAATYADYFLSDLLDAASGLRLDMEVIRAHKRYREGFFVDAIEKTLDNSEKIKQILEQVSGRKLDPQWSPVQVLEGGYLKNREILSIDKAAKTITYKGKDDELVVLPYSEGQVKLNWRVDWPARWWLLNVQAEPFGRDHATKGGSYDTGKVIAADIFGVEAPLPIPYNFINKTGETKKMSKSKGDTVTAADLLKIFPPEVIWFFILRYAPDKALFFDTSETLIKLFDEFSELLSKADKSDQEKHLLELCLFGIDEPTVSRVPFTHLYVSYQASLRDVDKTLDVIRRTEYKDVVEEDEQVIIKELAYIDNWLDTWAPEENRFSLRAELPEDDLTDIQKDFMGKLAEVIKSAPEDADGEWFHKAIYAFKESHGLSPKELFATLYSVLIGKDSGPRAGWFLSILPRDWLIERLLLRA